MSPTMAARDRGPTTAGLRPDCGAQAPRDSDRAVTDLRHWTGPQVHTTVPASGDAAPAGSVAP
jgi:hypothetical protein